MASMTLIASIGVLAFFFVVIFGVLLWRIYQSFVDLINILKHGTLPCPPVPVTRLTDEEAIAIAAAFKPVFAGHLVVRAVKLEGGRPVWEISMIALGGIPYFRIDDSNGEILSFWTVGQR